MEHKINVKSQNNDEMKVPWVQYYLFLHSQQFLKLKSSLKEILFNYNLMIIVFIVFSIIVILFSNIF